MTKYWIGLDPNAEATTEKCAALAALSALEIALLDGAGTGGTPVAGKVVVADANQNIGVIKGTTLNIGTSGSETALSAAEIVRACDVSARIVTLVATGAITEVLHEGKILLLGEVGGNAAITLTLPAATGGGGIYRFIVSVLNARANGYKIAVVGNDTIDGSVNILDADGTTQAAYAATSTDDTFIMNGTTTGGQIGDWVEFVDIAADQWAVRGQLVCPAGSNIADPFSATVT